MTRKHINPWDYWGLFREHGIDPLTGEADGTGLRVLYDLSVCGEEIITEFFGGCTPTYMGMNNWPNGKGCLLPRSMETSLAIYLLMRDGYRWVIQGEQGITGYDNRDEWSSVALAPKSICYVADGTAKNGLRNRHEMSGRVE